MVARSLWADVESVSEDWIMIDKKGFNAKEIL
jgi:hypothetical protein